MPDLHEQLPTLTEDERYDLAKNDPVAGPILAALHEQDARTYTGNSGDIAGLAWATASKIDRAVRADERAQVANLLREHRDVFVGYGDVESLMNALPLFLTLGDR